MSNSSIDLDNLARLARLELTPEEKDKLGPQLERIVGYVNQLSRVNVDGIEPMAHAVEFENVWREDEAVEPLDREKGLANAPLQRDGMVVVPRVIE